MTPRGTNSTRARRRRRPVPEDQGTARLHGPGPVIVITATLLLAAAHAHNPGHAARHVGSSAGAASRAAVSTGANVRLAKRMAARAGWTCSQWECLDWLWTRESGFRMVWNTQGSGAYGIPQALPATKMAAAGADYMTSPATQIQWGLGYIGATYGDPCGAWQHEIADGWY